MSSTSQPASITKYHHIVTSETEIHRGLRTPTENPPVEKQVAARSRQGFASKLQLYSEEFFGAQSPNLPSPDQKHVRDWPLHSGDLGPTEIDIIESTPSRILSQKANQKWSAELITRSFIKRATIPSISQTPSQICLANQLMDDLNKLLECLQDIIAVLYCKINVPQGLMSRECTNYVFGRTICPDNTDLSAGGSSGGEGSLIALGGSPLGIGTDIAGSIRTPARLNAIYGLCPSYGRLPIHFPQTVALGPTVMPRPWNETAFRDIEARAVSPGGLIFGPFDTAPPHGAMNYYFYGAISNILDWTCATIPVWRVDPILDSKPGPDPTFAPMSDADRESWDKCKYPSQFLASFFINRDSRFT
ncbi:acetamidase [Fusarium beomiforme]|uniref:amidase n=1 Tax=Fusarium beomiforme TaxID=44412 RepID=A0A9P5AQG2_9HYPO|nr:acetamidase [Fusarium beomiforme]